jgi:hypothetical protein
MSNLTLQNFKKDVYFPKVAAAMADVLAKGKVVSPIQVFQHMQLLDSDKVADWKMGRIPFLEKVIKCNLNKASRVLRLMRFHAHDLKRKPSPTVYKRKSMFLRFTKTCDPNLELAYATCFVTVYKKPTPEIAVVQSD